MKFDFGRHSLDLSYPHVMGILNITPDSFSDGGLLYVDGRPALDTILARASSMLNDGATLLDVGGESTRPGADKVSSQEECDRVLPVVEALSARFNTVISVDTSNPVLMRQSADAGAGLINDVRALTVPGALEAVSEANLPACLMHMQGQPGTMQAAVAYESVVDEVADFFRERIGACREAGIDTLLLDPGIGFGKRDEHNITLLRKLARFDEFALPLLVGVSRKSFIGRLMGCSVGERLPASLAFAYASMQNGAKILRVHDVRETRDVVEAFKLMKCLD
ncbi:MAG: dihydropteroate synthase [Flavobacteriales bacterium]|jgi:dihydropteroate synthase